MSKEKTLRCMYRLYIYICFKRSVVDNVFAQNTHGLGTTQNVLKPLFFNQN